MEKLAAEIQSAIDTFRERPNSQIQVLDRNGIYYGLHYDALSTLDYAALKRQIVSNMKAESSKITQLVGDSHNFSKTGTGIAREFIAQYLRGKHIIEYGFTGYLVDGDELDLNSLVNEYIEANPGEAYRVLANVVDHTVTALSVWGCRVSSKVRHYVVVYGSQSTRFGDDVLASDLILNKHDNDLLVVVEGGAQSFTQIVNVLENDVHVVGLVGVRSPERRKFFSATEFLAVVKRELEEDPDIPTERVKEIADKYMSSHLAWDPSKPDADTKGSMFYSTMERFINKRVYKKLTELVEIEHATQTQH
jgi:hypothetical protein